MMKIVAVALLTFVTCAFAPSELTQFQPPEHYREIWKTAEECTGKHGNFDKITWYEVPGNSFTVPDGTAIGYWSGNTITLAHDWKGTDWVVKHESIHAITRYKHDGMGSKPGPRDSLVWGRQCHAMWGFQPHDTLYVP